MGSKKPGYFQEDPRDPGLPRTDLVVLVFACRLKLECEKLAGEKTEMQRHYVMVSRGSDRRGEEKRRSRHR